MAGNILTSWLTISFSRTLLHGVGSHMIAVCQRSEYIPSVFTIAR